MPERDDLIGVWELESWRISYSDGREDTYPYGVEATGQLIYDASGRMAVTVSVDRRPRLSNENIRRAPQEEKAQAFDTFFHYTGRWSLGDEEVYHDIDMALNPNFVGTRQTRGIEPFPDGFILVAVSETPTGATMRNELTWWRPLG